MTSLRLLLPATFGLCSLVLSSGLRGQLLAPPAGAGLSVSLTNQAPDADYDQLTADLAARGNPGTVRVIGASRRSDRLELFSDLFTPGELATASTLSNLASATRSGLRADPGTSSASAYAGAIGTSLVYGSGPNADAWPALNSWAYGRDRYRNILGRELMPMTLDFTRKNPFYDSQGGFSDTLNWIGKAVVLLPSAHGSRAANLGSNALRFGTLEVIAGDLHRQNGNGQTGDFADFCRTWLKRTSSVVLAAALSPFLAEKPLPNVPGIPARVRAARMRPEFPVTLSYSY